MNETRASLQQQLRDAREHLLHVQERMAEYIVPTDIPLEFSNTERHWNKRITELEAQLDQLVEAAEPSRPVAQPDPGERERLAKVPTSRAALLGFTYAARSPEG